MPKFNKAGRSDRAFALWPLRFPWHAAKFSAKAKISLFSAEAAHRLRSPGRNRHTAGQRQYRWILSSPVNFDLLFFSFCLSARGDTRLIIGENTINYTGIDGLDGDDRNSRVLVNYSKSNVFRSIEQRRLEIVRGNRNGEDRETKKLEKLNVLGDNLLLLSSLNYSDYFSALRR